MDGLKLDTAIILAGGKSSRMQRDKSLLEFAGEPSLTHFVAKKLSHIFKNVYVSAKADKFTNIKSNLKLNVLLDENVDQYSPMSALATILQSLDKPVFIQPVDMPFISIKSILSLAKYSDKFDAVVAASDKNIHNLCGFFSPNLAVLAKRLYNQNNHKIGFLLSLCNLKVLNFKDENEFKNINYPHEYKEALKEYCCVE